MMSDITILTSRELDAVDKNLIKLINFCGLKSNILKLSGSDASIVDLSKQISKDTSCLMINYNFLTDIIPNIELTDTFRSFLFSKIPFAMVYNVSPDDLPNSAIEHLSYGAFRSVNCHEVSQNNYQITDDFRDICRQFSGLSFETRNNNIDFALNMGKQNIDIFNLITINKLPFFVKFKIENCHLFILANNKILDIDDKATEPWSIKEYFSQFIPLMMFIKYVFGDRCWHSKQAYASFIIDDPLLRMNYGFLNYRRLLELMDQNNFHTALAFIPWNYKRSSKETALLFNERKDRFTLCVHGCYHTNNEFGINERDKLNRISKLSIERMKIHKKLSGVNFDNVIVFPQGKFSSKAMEVLKTNDYLASVNSDIVSTDYFCEFKISDLLDMAIMKYSCFPLFVRRYPEELIDFAFELFFDKPVFIVVHHDYFRDGYNKIKEFIRSINLLQENIHWDGLREIIKRSYLEKKGLDERNHIKMYANECEIKNTSETYNKYFISKKECGEVPVSSVIMNGKDISYILEDQWLKLAIEVPPKTTATLKINYEDIYPYVIGKDTLKEQTEVWIRRYLSELRDNYISKSELLLSISKKAIQLKRSILQK